VCGCKDFGIGHGIMEESIRGECMEKINTNFSNLVVYFYVVGF
jgi:hypothetical protein